MSEEVAPAAAAAAPAPQETPVAEAPVEAKPEMNLNTALQTVLKEALFHDNLARGIHECAKALYGRKARLCILAENCEEAGIKALVEALCKENNINLIRVPSASELGQWAGLCKLDREGNPRRKFDAEGKPKESATPRCSCVVIKQFGRESEAKAFLEKAMNNKA